ncbi:MAG: ferredoxin [bacterium]|nr:ferredoxin [bacterium]
MKRIKIVVDPDLCIGAASCVTIKPTVYQLNEENKAIVLDPNNPTAEPSYTRDLEVSETDFEEILLGAQSCPTRAIFIYDEAGTQIYPEA